MIEFAAGISVGILIGLVLGLYARELLPRQQEQRPIVVNVESNAPVAHQPQSLPYQPPIIVLAAPRAPQQPGRVLRVEQPTTLPARV